MMIINQISRVLTPRKHNNKGKNSILDDDNDTGKTKSQQLASILLAVISNESTSSSSPSPSPSPPPSEESSSSSSSSSDDSNVNSNSSAADARIVFTHLSPKQNKKYHEIIHEQQEESEELSIQQPPPVSYIFVPKNFQLSDTDDDDENDDSFHNFNNSSNENDYQIRGRFLVGPPPRSEQRRNKRILLQRQRENIYNADNDWDDYSIESHLSNMKTSNSSSDEEEEEQKEQEEQEVVVVDEKQQQRKHEDVIAAMKPWMDRHKALMVLNNNTTDANANANTNTNTNNQKQQQQEQHQQQPVSQHRRVVKWHIQH